mmetsp:Transcript_676/g.1235  ORF Transcript_676/g.1235 Transcript_676/m.1235 type:complete len:207 (+) Transcript_676:1228-1848(+)
MKRSHYVPLTRMHHAERFGRLANQGYEECSVLHFISSSADKHALLREHERRDSLGVEDSRRGYRVVLSGSGRQVCRWVALHLLTLLAGRLTTAVVVFPSRLSASVSVVRSLPTSLRFILRVSIGVHRRKVRVDLSSVVHFVKLFPPSGPASRWQSWLEGSVRRQMGGPSRSLRDPPVVGKLSQEVVVGVVCSRPFGTAFLPVRIEQ